MQTLCSPSVTPTRLRPRLGLRRPRNLSSRGDLEAMSAVSTQEVARRGESRATGAGFSNRIATTASKATGLPARLRAGSGPVAITPCCSVAASPFEVGRFMPKACARGATAE